MSTQDRVTALWAPYVALGESLAEKSVLYRQGCAANVLAEEQPGSFTSCIELQND